MIFISLIISSVGAFGGSCLVNARFALEHYNCAELTSSSPPPPLGSVELALFLWGTL